MVSWKNCDVVASTPSLIDMLLVLASTSTVLELITSVVYGLLCVDKDGLLAVDSLFGIGESGSLIGEGFSW